MSDYDLFSIVPIEVLQYVLAYDLGNALHRILIYLGSKCHHAIATHLGKKDQ